MKFGGHKHESSIERPNASPKSAMVIEVAIEFLSIAINTIYRFKNWCLLKFMLPNRLMYESSSRTS